MALLISKTTFLEFLLCPKNIWLKLHKPELMEQFTLSAFEQQLAEQGNEVEAVAHGLFPGGVEVTGRGEAGVEETKQLMASSVPYIFQATFIVDGFIAKVDVLRRGEGGAWDILEIKGTNSLKEEGADRSHLDDLTFQTSVLRRAGVSVGACILVHLNKEYVRSGELEIEKLFVFEDITEKVEDHLQEVELQMEAAKEHLTKDTEPMQGCDCIYKGRSAHCSTFAYSNPEVPEYSIHDLARIGSSKKKLQSMVERKLFGIDEVPADISLSEIQENQAQVYRTNSPIIETEKIREHIAPLQLPLYFLDYETFAPAIPMFNGYSPYARIPFQFSLHILRDPQGELEHVEYLHEEHTDPSPIVAQLLAKHIESGGTVISWNKSFEQGVNKELVARLPEHASTLLRINEHMYDLREIFQKQYYVHPLFKGKTSVKKVLPALVEGIRHADLNITEGGQASEAWMQLLTGTPEEKAKIAEDLRTYCALDTYAMFQIWEHLYQMVME